MIGVSFRAAVNALDGVDSRAAYAEALMDAMGKVMTAEGCYSLSDTPPLRPTVVPAVSLETCFRVLENWKPYLQDLSWNVTEIEWSKGRTVLVTPEHGPWTEEMIKESKKTKYSSAGAKRGIADKSVFLRDIKPKNLAHLVGSGYVLRTDSLKVHVTMGENVSMDYFLRPAVAICAAMEMMGCTTVHLPSFSGYHIGTVSIKRNLRWPADVVTASNLVLLNSFTIGNGDYLMVSSHEEIIKVSEMSESDYIGWILKKGHGYVEYSWVKGMSVEKQMGYYKEVARVLKCYKNGRIIKDKRAELEAIYSDPTLLTVSSNDIFARLGEALV
jgi:hypothetical protein